MVVLAQDGQAVTLEGTLESDLTRILVRYIERAANPADRNRRVKHVLAFDGQHHLGLTREDLSRALGIRNHLRETLAALVEELRAIAGEMKLEDEQSQARFERSLKELPEE